MALMLLFTAIMILPISPPVFAQEEEEIMPKPSPIDDLTGNKNAPPAPGDPGDPLAEKSADIPRTALDRDLILDTSLLGGSQELSGPALPAKLLDLQPSTFPKTIGSAVEGVEGNSFPTKPGSAAHRIVSNTLYSGATAGIRLPPTSPQSSAVAVFPSRNQPAAAVAGQKVRLPTGAIAPNSAKLGAIAPNN
jgi:hypothetical protein